MSLFDGINVAEQAMGVHRLRSEVAGDNLAHAYTQGYHRKVVDLADGGFSAALANASGGGPTRSSGSFDTTRGAVRVAGIRTEGGVLDERTAAMLGVVEMMQSKSAYELNMRAATMMKSMMLASLEIGRGA